MIALIGSGDSSCRLDSLRGSTTTLSCTNHPVLGSSADVVILQDASDVPRRLPEKCNFFGGQKKPAASRQALSPPHSLGSCGGVSGLTAKPFLQIRDFHDLARDVFAIVRRAYRYVKQTLQKTGD